MTCLRRLLGSITLISSYASSVCFSLATATAQKQFASVIQLRHSPPIDWQDTLLRALWNIFSNTSPGSSLIIMPSHVDLPTQEKLRSLSPKRFVKPSFLTQPTDEMNLAFQRHGPYWLTGKLTANPIWPYSLSWSRSSFPGFSHAVGALSQEFLFPFNDALLEKVVCGSHLA